MVKDDAEPCMVCRHNLFYSYTADYWSNTCAKAVITHTCPEGYQYKTCEDCSKALKRFREQGNGKCTHFQERRIVAVLDFFKRLWRCRW